MKRALLVPLFAAAVACSKSSGDGGDSKTPRPLPSECVASAVEICRSIDAELASAETRFRQAIEKQDVEAALEARLESERLSLRRTLARDGLSEEEERSLEEAVARWQTLLQTPSEDEGELPACEDDPGCVQARDEVPRLRFALSEVSAVKDLIEVYAVRLELNYRIGLVKSDQEAKAQLAEDHKRLMSVIHDLRTGFGRPGSAYWEVSPCPQATVEHCGKLRHELVKLRNDYTAAIESRDKKAAQELLAEIHLKRELLTLAEQGHGPKSKAAKDAMRRHELLRRIVQGPLGVEPYTEAERLAVDEVFRDFGPLYIKESARLENGHLEARDVEAKGPMPWSAYWYPMQRSDLFGEDDSPLAKLDKLVRARGGESATRDWELERYDPYSADWAGLCDAWATAAILEPEPQRNITVDGVEFTIGDLKGLAIKKYDGTTPKIYGRRYFGNHETDGQLQDLRPEAFHRLVEVVIGEKGQAIAVDSDPGPEVWSRPMFRMRWTVEKDPEVDHAFIVKAFPRMIAHRPEVDDEVTTPRDVKLPRYAYRLIYDPDSKREDGAYRVIYGEWIENSVNDHPDMAFVVSKDAPLKHRNPEIGKVVHVIDELLELAR